MRKIKLFASFAALLLLMASCGGGNKTGTETTENADNNETTKVDDSKFFTSEKGKFKINFPGTPKETSQDVETAVGTIQMVSYMHEASLSEAYMVAYSDYPASAVKDSNTDEMLENAMGGFVGQLGITIEKQEKITMGDAKGISFKGTGNGVFTVMKDYLVDNRLYQIGILRSDRYPTDEEVNNFINSFKLVK